jgi:hypothetical protein
MAGATEQYHGSERQRQIIIDPAKLKHVPIVDPEQLLSSLVEPRIEEGIYDVTMPNRKAIHQTCRAIAAVSLTPKLEA